MMGAYIRVTGLENIVEAQLMESILQEKGIPHRMRSFHDTAYDGLFQFQKGWGEIFAPPERKQEILGIIELVRSEDEPPVSDKA
jgi:hypothetical protein